MNNTRLHTILRVYGILNILGGIMGFAMAKSVVSLGIGTVAGALILILARLTATKPAIAYRSLGMVVLCLVGFWGYQVSQPHEKSSAMVRAVVFLALGLYVLGSLANAHFAAQKNKAA